MRRGRKRWRGRVVSERQAASGNLERRGLLARRLTEGVEGLAVEASVKGRGQKLNKTGEDEQEGRRGLRARRWGLSYAFEGGDRDTEGRQMFLASVVGKLEHERAGGDWIVGRRNSVARPGCESGMQKGEQRP